MISLVLKLKNCYILTSGKKRHPSTFRCPNRNHFSDAFSWPRTRIVSSWSDTVGRNPASHFTFCLPFFSEVRLSKNIPQVTGDSRGHNLNIHQPHTSVGAFFVEKYPELICGTNSSPTSLAPRSRSTSSCEKFPPISLPDQLGRLVSYFFEKGSSLQKIVILLGRQSGSACSGRKMFQDQDVQLLKKMSHKKTSSNQFSGFWLFNLGEFTFEIHLHFFKGFFTQSQAETALGTSYLHHMGHSCKLLAVANVEMIEETRPWIGMEGVECMLYPWVIRENGAHLSYSCTNVIIFYRDCFFGVGCSRIQIILKLLCYPPSKFMDRLGILGGKSKKREKSNFHPSKSTMFRASFSIIRWFEKPSAGTVKSFQQ